jgi:hypothetical protein
MESSLLERNYSTLLSSSGRVYKSRAAATTFVILRFLSTADGMGTFGKWGYVGVS